MPPAHLRRPDRPLLLTIPGLHGVLQFRNAGPVAAALAKVLNGWVPRPWTGPARAPAIATVTCGPAGFDVRSAFLDRPIRGLPLASAVNALCADLLEAWTAAHPDHVCLHAGGAVFGGSAVAFLGEARAGKSTLMARLTAEPAVPVLADDVLPVSPRGEALGLGVPPRLRLPLPAGASAAFRAHIAASAGPGDDLYAYLDAATAAPHGTRAPLDAVVILRRTPGAAARLHELGDAEALHQLATRRITAGPGEDGRLDRVAAIADRVRMLRLVYSDLEDAVALVTAAFGPGAAGIEPGPPLPAPEAPPAAAAPLPDPAQRWRRSPVAAVRRHGGRSCLWSAAAGKVVQLNLTARAVWELLDAPASQDELADGLSALFPEAGRARIAADLGPLLAGFAAAGLIAPADPG